jgi:hypothetical protein
MFYTNKQLNRIKAGELKTLLFLFLVILNLNTVKAQFWDTTYLPKPYNELHFDTLDNILLIIPNSAQYNGVSGDFFSFDGSQIKKLASTTAGVLTGVTQFKNKTFVYGAYWAINGLPKTGGWAEWNIQNNTYTKVDTGGLLGDGPFAMQEFNKRLYFGLLGDYYKKNLGYLDSNFKQHYHPDSVPLPIQAMTVYNGKLIFTVDYRPRNYPNLSHAYDSLVAGNCVAYLDSNFVLHPFAKNSTTNGGFGWFINYHGKLYASGAFNVLDGDSVTGFVVYNDSLDKWEPATDQRLYCDCNANFGRMPALWSSQIFKDKIVITGEISHIDTAKAYCVIEYDEQSRKFGNLGMPYMDGARWSGVYKNSFLVSFASLQSNNTVINYIGRMRWDTTSTDNVKLITNKINYILSPNPASGYCLLKSDNEKENIFSLIDAGGKLIISDAFKKEYRINTSKLSKGVYQVVIGTKKDYKTTTLKLVVE